MCAASTRRRALPMNTSLPQTAQGCVALQDKVNFEFVGARCAQTALGAIRLERRVVTAALAP